MIALLQTIATHNLELCRNCELRADSRLCLSRQSDAASGTSMCRTKPHESLGQTDHTVRRYTLGTVEDCCQAIPGYLWASPQNLHKTVWCPVQKILKSNFQLLIRKFSRAIFNYSFGFLGLLILWLQSPANVFFAAVTAAAFLLPILLFIFFIFSPFFWL